MATTNKETEAVEPQVIAQCATRGWNSPQVCLASKPVLSPPSRPPSPGRAGWLPRELFLEDQGPLPWLRWCPSDERVRPLTCKWSLPKQPKKH